MYWFKPGGHLDRRPFHPKMLLKAKMERTVPTRMGVQSKTSKAKSVVLKGVHNHKIWPSPTFRMSKFSKTVQGVSLGGTSWAVTTWSGSVWPQRQPRILSSYPAFTFTVAVQADKRQIKHTIHEPCYWYSDKKAYVNYDLLDGARKAGNIQTASPKSCRWDDKTWKSAHLPLLCPILTIIRSPGKSKTRER